MPTNPTTEQVMALAAFVGMLCGALRLKDLVTADELRELADMTSASMGEDSTDAGRSVLRLVLTVADKLQGDPAD